MSAQFADVPAGSPFYPYIRTIACRGVVGGYADGTFRPGSPITRAQVTKYIVNAAGITDAIPADRQTFVDVPHDHPFWLFVEQAAAHGLISGYSCGGPGEPCPGTYFRPGTNLTRAQLTKIVTNAVGPTEPVSGQLFEDVPAAFPLYAYVERMALHGVISGYGVRGGAGGACVSRRATCRTLRPGTT